MLINTSLKYLQTLVKYIKKYSFWIIFTGAIFIYLWSDFVTINLTHLLNILQSISIYHLFLYSLLGLIAVSATTIYDFILCWEFNLKIDPRKVFKISWIADIPIVFAKEQEKRKGDLRYSLYAYEGVASSKARLISTLKDIFIIGDESTLPQSFKLRFMTRLKLIFGFFIKWLCACGLFLYICSTFNIDASWIRLILIFGIAMIVSNLSLVPGGLFVFEFLCLLGFKLSSIPLQTGLIVVILFRVVYNLIPWLITLIGLTRLGHLEGKRKLSESQVYFIQKVSIRALSCLTFFGGIVLILSASISRNKVDILMLNPNELFLSKLITLISLFIGLMLLILSKSIWEKVHASYYITLILLVIGIVLSLLTVTNWLTSCILLVIIWTLKPMKPSFYRSTTTFSWDAFGVSLAVILSVVGLYAFMIYLLLEQPPFTLSHYSQPYFYLEALVVLLMIFISACLLTVLSARHMDFELLPQSELDKLKSFLNEYEGNSMTHLLFLKDKQLFYAADDRVIIGYRAYKDKLIVLGDPIGDTKYFTQAINDFRVFADHHRMIPLFYEISEDYLPIYHENGLKFFKLGEEAIMPLSEFTLVGKKYAQLRTIKNKMLRGEFTFELHQPPFTNDLLAELQDISEAWLEGRREKAFSLGSFDECYINLAPIAIIKQEENIIGFATIMPMYSKNYISIDLMRLVPNPPNGAMDALFVGIIEWAIEEGYQHFVLGKAPLSNVGYNEFSPTKEKIVKYIYQYGNKIYSFKGLRRYKEKYHPEWKGIYFAYPKHTNLSVAILQLTKMISGND